MPALDPTDPGSALELGYADAVAELEQILGQLGGDEVDVDHLAAQVRRASELIALCRSRLSAAQMEVSRIVADLDAVAAMAPTVTATTDGDLGGVTAGGPAGDGHTLLDLGATDARDASSDDAGDEAVRDEAVER